MYKVGILEDDETQAQVLARMLRESSHAFELDIVGTMDAANDRLSFEDWAASLDILFTDIQLGDGQDTGIDVVKKISELGICPQVIYVTGYPEYASEVYHTDHVWFLIKPFSAEDLEAALERALEGIRADRDSALLVRQRATVERVLPAQIIYIESDKRKLRIHLADRILEPYAKLGVVAEKLPSHFVQCHKSFLVNMDRVERFESNHVILDDGTVLPVSQRFRRQAIQAYVAYIGRTV